MFFKKKDKSIDFVALGGQHDVGMNCLAYEYDNQWLMVDCGIALRSSNDVQADRIIPDFSALKGKNVQAILLTHWHMDHIGAVPYAVEELGFPPVYGTPLTLAKTKSMFEGSHAKLLKKVKFIEVSPQGETVKLGKFTAQFIHSSHLTPQSSMIAVKTPVGTLLQTGDWTLSPNPVVEPVTNIDEIKALNKENFLGVIGDSTEIYRKTPSHGEDEITQTLIKHFKKAKKRIFVPMFSSSTARMQGVYEAAKAVGRETCLLGRSVEENSKLAKSCGFLSKCKYIPLEKARQLPENKVVYIVTGCQGETLAAFPRILNGKYKGLTLNRDDFVLFSSSIIPGNEREILPMYDKVVEKGAGLITLQDDLVHSHGHGGYDDFVRFYKEIVKPKALVPTHGGAMSKFYHGELAKKYGVKDVLHVKNGQVISFYPDKSPEITGEVDAGEVAIEGVMKLSTHAEVFKNRKKVFYEGAIIITLVLDKQGNLQDKPILSSLGVFESDESGIIKKTISIEIMKALKKLPKQDRKQQSKQVQTTNTAVRFALKSFVSRFKRPKILIHFVEK